MRNLELGGYVQNNHNLLEKKKACRLTKMIVMDQMYHFLMGNKIFTDFKVFFCES